MPCMIRLMQRCGSCPRAITIMNVSGPTTQVSACSKMPAEKQLADRDGLQPLTQRNGGFGCNELLSFISLERDQRPIVNKVRFPCDEKGPTRLGPFLLHIYVNGMRT